MDRPGAILAAALFLLPPAARAQAGGEIALPLHGSPPLPRLDSARLKGKAAHAVRAAIAAARLGRREARAAGPVIRAAMKAGGKAGKARGYDALDVPGADGTACLYQGRVSHGRATGLGTMHCRARIFMGRFRDGRLNGLGGDSALGFADAYQGEYRDGARSGYGVERDKDGSYPGRFASGTGAGAADTGMEVLGLQDFQDVIWAGYYGLYNGPKIACTRIKGAVLEGSVLNGYGAKFDAAGHSIEQGFYRQGRLERGSGPPC